MLFGLEFLKAVQHQNRMTAGFSAGSKQKQGFLSNQGKPKYLTEGRSDVQQILESCEQFACQWQTHINHYGTPPPHAVLNVDESLMIAIEDKVKIVCVTCAKKQRASFIGTRKGKMRGSIAAVISAAGKLFFFFRAFILKVKFDDNGIGKAPQVLIPQEDLVGVSSSRGIIPTKFYYSQSGLLDKDIYHSIMKDFIAEWSLTYPSLHCFVFADHLASYRQEPIIRYVISVIFVFSMNN